MCSGGPLLKVPRSMNSPPFLPEAALEAVEAPVVEPVAPLAVVAPPPAATPLLSSSSPLHAAATSPRDITSANVAVETRPNFTGNTSLDLAARGPVLHA